MVKTIEEAESYCDYLQLGYIYLLLARSYEEIKTISSEPRI